MTGHCGKDLLGAQRKLGQPRPEPKCRPQVDQKGVSQGRQGTPKKQETGRPGQPQEVVNPHQRHGHPPDTGQEHAQPLGQEHEVGASAETREL